MAIIFSHAAIKTFGWEIDSPPHKIVSMLDTGCTPANFSPPAKPMIIYMNSKLVIKTALDLVICVINIIGINDIGVSTAKAPLFTKIPINISTLIPVFSTIANNNITGTNRTNIMKRTSIFSITLTNSRRFILMGI